MECQGWKSEITMYCSRMVSEWKIPGIFNCILAKINLLFYHL